MSGRTSDVAFTDAVKAMQRRLGSRAAMQAMAERRDFQAAITAELESFLARRDSFYLATASADGQPYIQHRGGAPGFLRVLDPHTLAFADFAGNRQYVSLGNLSENPRVALFVMDYAERRRVKIWGEGRVVDDDPDLLARLRPHAGDAVAQRVIVVRVTAWDVNCQQHITPRHDHDTVAQAMERLMLENAALREELARRRATPPAD